MEVTWITLVGLLIIGICKIFQNIYEYYLWRKKINTIPGPRARCPIIGVSWEIIKINREDRIRWFHSIADRYKNGIFRMWIGTDPSIHVNKPEHAEVILRSTKLIDKSKIYEFLEAWLGKGLLTSTGEKWFHDRKLITPAFHFGILEEFSEVMVEKAGVLNQRMAEQVKLHGENPFDVFDMICKCALDIICETAMGVNVHAQDEIENEYIKAVQCISTNAVSRIFRPWLKLNCVYSRTTEGKMFKAAINTAHAMCTNVIEQKRLERQQKATMSAVSANKNDEIDKPKRRAFLDLLLEASEKNTKPLTIEEIREQVNTFMFAGHDTTGALISWALFCIGNDEKVQNSIHQELDEVFGDSDEPTTTKQVSQLKYLDRVIKEVLRLYPSATAISRKITEDIKMGPYMIPKGCTLALQIRQLHRDPTLWPNPTQFDPDRFLPENSADRHPYAYIPFSGGPRNCIGQKYATLEAKIVLTEVLRKWRIKSRDSHENVKAYAAIILRPHEGIFLNLYNRRNN